MVLGRPTPMKLLFIVTKLFSLRTARLKLRGLLGMFTTIISSVKVVHLNERSAAIVIVIFLLLATTEGIVFLNYSM